jgi:phospholipid/cholesterol/gamma-HCH transport system ATP-binding protein
MALGPAAELAQRDEPELVDYFREGRSQAFLREAQAAATKPARTPSIVNTDIHRSGAP